MFAIYFASLYCLLPVNAALSHTFWQEVEMMVDSNDIPPYLQDALTHATFEQLDLDHDGVASPAELQEYLSKITADSAEGLDAFEEFPVRYPVFEITPSMSPEEKENVCMMVLVYENIDMDSDLKKYTNKDVFAENVASIFEKLPVSMDYDLWQGIGQRKFLPQAFSDELIIPEGCLSGRRKLLGPQVLAAVGAFAWAELTALVLALVGSGVETVIMQCLNKHWHWAPHQENCNKEHFARQFVHMLLVEQLLLVPPLTIRGYLASPYIRAAAHESGTINAATIGNAIREGTERRLSGVDLNYHFCPPIQENMDHTGDDLDAGGYLGRVPGHMDHRSDCSGWCRANPQCAGWVYVKTQPRRDNCIVKSTWKATSVQSSSCCDSQQITRGCI